MRVIDMEPYDKVRSREVRARLREVLMEQWDPIGVEDYPEAADEYDSYLTGVFGLLSRSATDAEIASYLRSMETQHMGVKASPDDRLMEVVQQLRREYVKRYPV